MIVVADSGPLNYLILLDHAELLHRLYDEVVIPDAVAAELSSPPTWIWENARRSLLPGPFTPTCY